MRVRRAQHFQAALDDFGKRERRFGAITEARVIASLIPSTSTAQQEPST
jgi:hypothetical protein